MSDVKFGTGGFRGIIGDDFTRENIEKICQAIANIANKNNLKKEIFIGYDNRFMSEKFARWSAEVLASNNLKPSLFNSATSTPVVMYTSKINHTDFGIMITASHNPYEFNGIKVFTKDGRDASLEETKLIEEEFNNIKEIKKDENSHKNIQYSNYVNGFLDYLIANQNIKDIKNYNVIFDSKYGSTTQAINIFCNKIGLSNYKILNDTRDAFFGFETPAPSIDNIELLKENVLNNKANIGFALDADGDRLAVIDEKGNFIDNNFLLALVYYYNVKYEGMKGDVVKTIATSNILNHLANKFGYKCHEVPVGFKFVSSKLIETNAVVGGESSGGLAVLNHIWGKDSLLTIALCLKIMSKLNKPFSEIIEELKEFADSFSKVMMEKQYCYNKDKENEIKDKLFNKKIIPNLEWKIESINSEGYYKIYYENENWLLVRFSGTEPVLRIFVEADNFGDCNKLIKSMEDVLNLK